MLSKFAGHCVKIADSKNLGQHSKKSTQSSIPTLACPGYYMLRGKEEEKQGEGKRSNLRKASDVADIPPTLKWVVMAWLPTKVHGTEHTWKTFALYLDFLAGRRLSTLIQLMYDASYASTWYFKPLWRNGEMVDDQS